VSPGPLQIACFRLLSSLRWLSERQTKLRDSFDRFMEEAYAQKGETTILPVGLAALVLSDALKHLRVLNEIRNIIVHIRTGTDPLPDPNRGVPFSPFIDGPEGALSERPTPIEFIDWSIGSQPARAREPEE
jgi:hypothetical protein